MQIKLIQIVAVILAVLVIANLVLFSLGMIKPIGFWVILAVCALGAYKAVPAMKK